METIKESYRKAKDFYRKYPRLTKTLIGVRIAAYAIIGYYVLDSKGCSTQNTQIERLETSKIERIVESSNKPF